MIHRPSRMVWLCVALIGLTPPAFAQISSPLPLAEAQRIALARAPALAASAAQAQAAREMAVAAGSLPDPVLRLGVSNVPVSGDMAWSTTRDGMSMRSIGLMQEFTRSETRAAARARSEQAAGLAQAEGELARSEIARETALAWLALRSLQSQRALLVAQLDTVQDQAQAASAAFRSGRGEQAGVFAQQTEAGQLHSMLLGMDGEIAMARAQLTRWLGEAPGELAALPDITRLARDWRQGDGAELPALVVPARQAALADADARYARARRKPDVAVELMYGKRGSSYDDMVSVTLSMPLPWNRSQRQDRELGASLAMAEQARALQADAQRLWRAEIDGLHAGWQSALARLNHADATLIPLAEQQHAAVLATWRAGGSSLAEVLQARRALLEARLARERVALEAARAWAQLNFLDAQTLAQGD